MKNKKICELGARAVENGVIFYSNEKPEQGFGAFLTENGSFMTMRKSDNITERYYYAKERMNYYSYKTFFYTIFALSVLMWILVMFNLSEFSIGASIFTAFVFPNIGWAVKTYSRIHKGNLEEISKAKYHGATHKVLNAYKKYGRIPTLKEIKQEAIIRKECGSYVFLGNAVMQSLLAIIAVLINYNDVFIFAIVPLLLFIYILDFCGIISPLEKLIVLEPDDMHIECALKALDSYCAASILTKQ